MDRQHLISHFFIHRTPVASYDFLSSFHPLSQKKGIFFFLISCFEQVLMLLSCTLWKGVIFLPTSWKRPQLEQAYWFWLVDEYIPPIPYEDSLLSLYFSLQPFLIVCLFVGLFWLFFLFYRKSRQGILLFFLFLSFSMIVFFLLIAWLRQYGQPYYLYMDIAAGPWILSTDVLLLCLLPLLRSKLRRSGRQSTLL